MEAGAGAIAFAARDERTFVSRARATSPLKLLTPSKRGHGGWAYVTTFGGGLVDGDRVRLDVRVAEGARAVLATQASTKVYRSPRGVSHTLEATVADDALLALLPDATICYAGARYAQRIAVDLAPRASLVLVDSLGAGRVTRGERWSFDRWEARLVVRRDGVERVVEALRLDATDGPIGRRFGRYEAIATMLLLGPLAAPTARAIHAEIAATPLDRAAEVVASASEIDDGVLVRFAATSTARLASAVRAHLAPIAPLLGGSGGDPWSRRADTIA